MKMYKVNLFENEKSALFTQDSISTEGMLILVLIRYSASQCLWFNLNELCAHIFGYGYGSLATTLWRKIGLLT
jgi:hypothetical protein